MSDEYEVFEFIEEDFDLSRRHHRLRLRQDSDPFDLEEAEFIRRYRLTKGGVKLLTEELKPLIKPPQKSSDLTAVNKILIALSFYATGSYQRIIGSSEGHVVAQQTVSKAIAEVTACLNSAQMRNKHIQFPTQQHERNLIKAKFYHKFGIPGVLGCIDCTQVAIIRPSQNEERFYCRKHYHSLNVQLICDADMQFLSVDASHGGATHDSFIWASHPLKPYVEGLTSTWFLGDSGYPLRQSLMTPIVRAPSGSPEAHYTQLHVRARNTIERAIGVLKSRFRCLLVHRVLNYAPEVAGSIINSCVILHNICNRASTPIHPLSEEEVAQELRLQPHNEPTVSATNNAPLQHGLATRRALVLRLWEERPSTT